MKKSWTVRRRVACLALLLVVLFASVAVFFTRSPAQPSFSHKLSRQEQDYISKIVRRHAFATTWDVFTSGQFKYGWQRLRDLPKAIVYAQGDQPDGKIWIHVGVPDAAQSDGYRLYSRHFLAQREERWIIVADF